MYYNAHFCNAQLILTITQKKSTQKSTLESTKVYPKSIWSIKKGKCMVTCLGFKNNNCI